MAPASGDDGRGPPAKGDSTEKYKGAGTSHPEASHRAAASGGVLTRFPPRVFPIYAFLKIIELILQIQFYILVFFI